MAQGSPQASIVANSALRLGPKPARFHLWALCLLCLSCTSQNERDRGPLYARARWGERELVLHTDARWRDSRYSLHVKAEPSQLTRPTAAIMHLLPHTPPLSVSVASADCDTPLALASIALWLNEEPGTLWSGALFPGAISLSTGTSCGKPHRGARSLESLLPTSQRPPVPALPQATLSPATLLEFERKVLSWGQHAAGHWTQCIEQRTRAGRGHVSRNLNHFSERLDARIAAQDWTGAFALSAVADRACDEAAFSSAHLRAAYASDPLRQALSELQVAPPNLQPLVPTPLLDAISEAPRCTHCEGYREVAAHTARTLGIRAPSEPLAAYFTTYLALLRTSPALDADWQSFATATQLAAVAATRNPRSPQWALIALSFANSLADAAQNADERAHAVVWWWAALVASDLAR